MVNISELRLNNLLRDFDGKTVIVNATQGGMIETKNSKHLYTAAGLFGIPLLTDEKMVAF